MTMNNTLTSSGLNYSKNLKLEKTKFQLTTNEDGFDPKNQKQNYSQQKPIVSGNFKPLWCCNFIQKI